MSDQLGRQLDHDATTRLVTTLTYLGAGPEAIADLQSRIDKITTADTRVVVGPIETDSEGRPVCGLSFNCDSYDPPVDGEPDPRALDDLRGLIASINSDDCIYSYPINVLLDGADRHPVGA